MRHAQTVVLVIGIAAAIVGTVHLLTAEHRAELARVAALHADFESARVRLEETGQLVGKQMQIHAAKHGLLPQNGMGFAKATSWKLASLRGLLLQRDQRVSVAYALFLGVDGTATPVAEARAAYVWSDDSSLDPFFEDLRPVLARWGPTERIYAADPGEFETKTRARLAEFTKGPVRP